MNIENLLKIIEIEKDEFEDLHITRFYSSFVVISKGKVIKVTNPDMGYCPLAHYLYDGIRKIKESDSELLKNTIKEAIEEKIDKFGHFTEKRELIRNDIAVPYGASEILMYAMNKKIIDAAVVVCDGAGTVIVNKPEIVQGIGARMNGLFLTSPIKTTINKLKKANCSVVFPDAEINQIEGVIRASKFGYKNIAVTVNGYLEDDLSKLKEIERNLNISVTSLIVCTTGIDEERIKEINEYADIVWSCASQEIREMTGKKAILQISTGIPVFVLTKKGLNLVAGYSSDEQLIRELNSGKQYLISGKCEGTKIGMGNFNACFK
ncbi:MAG: hypothetical protein COS17_01325 [Elusimicrobia bacterium CG02_land_8_20_14_3_00_37_13]|nr:MAG: hypothetical protein COS17_01325 [Elusimicrobia bacterium CG02_land_8_20_14_3_00_37_13]